MQEIEADFFSTLEQFEHIFLTCLNPFDDGMDHRMGIRKLVNLTFYDKELPDIKKK